MNQLDQYKFLTFKTVAVLEFVMKMCEKAQFLLKIDDDVFLNPPEILNYINYHQNETRKLYGFIFGNRTAIRDNRNKYKMRFDEYFGAKFPDYLNGPFIMMKTDLIPELYYTSLETKFFRFEDLFLTGFVALRLNIELVNVNGIFANLNRYENVKKIRYLIAYKMHRRIHLVYDLWKYQGNYNKVDLF